jgi:hypothetical protein
MDEHDSAAWRLRRSARPSALPVGHVSEGLEEGIDFEVPDF